MNFTGSFPEREFGAAASSDSIDLTGIQLHWFDRWLKEVDNGVEQEAPVPIFVMGSDEWRAETDWPLSDTQYRSYYLHSGGQANTLYGDGRLSAEPPDDQPADVYLYNPVRPVPTVGGQVILPGGNAAGPRGQQVVEERDDVLVYSTPVLSQSIEVIGPIELRLFVASSARDTDFTGKLVDVYPDGRAMILTEGILRALPCIIHGTRASRTRHGLRVAPQPVGHGECVSARPPHPAGGVEQQLPTVCPQQQHRR
jgi:putative CocE/NonD family hydrolase